MNDEDQDPQEALDEKDEDEETEDGDLSDPEKLKKKGLHIEGEVDEELPPVLDIAEDPHAHDPLREPIEPEIEDDENDIDLIDKEYADTDEL